MNASPIHWHEVLKPISADPAATLAITRSTLEKAGAHFERIADGDGETPALAVASFTMLGRPYEAAFLSYEPDSVFLLVPGLRNARSPASITRRILDQLADAGLIDLKTQVLDIARFEDSVSRGGNPKTAGNARSTAPIGRGLATGRSKGTHPRGHSSL